MELANKRKHTVQEIYDLPEDVRMELIDGILYDMAAPSSRHQRIVFQLGRKLADFLDARKGGCEVFVAPFAVFVNDDEYTYVEPDIVVVCDRDKVEDDGCHGAPDLVVEVVSESSRTRDYLTKLRIYDRAGVREYWIVEPDSGRVITYLFSEDEDKQKVAEFSADDTLTSWLYPDLRIDMKEIVQNAE